MYSLGEQGSLRNFLLKTLSGIPEAPLSVFQFSHGQSNPTYLVRTGDRSFVLRKKPPGALLHSAHAIEREYRVMKALQSTNVPVPTLYAFCNDVTVLGTPFYLMQHVKGTIYNDVSLPHLNPNRRAHIYKSMVHTLAALHSLHPDSHGLGDYGQKEGYCRRQIDRWAKQYMSSHSDRPLQEMIELTKALQANVPPDDNDPSKARITHGDFRLDNLIFDANDNVMAVLDWELSTLGDPLADLAYNCMTYYMPSIPGIPALPNPLPFGVPSETEYILWYCEAAGIQVPGREGFGFYVALALFRLASILAGVGARAAQGNASSKMAETMGSRSVIVTLARTALGLLTKRPKFCLGLGPSSTVEPILQKLSTFMKDSVFPAEQVFEKHANSDERWTIHPLQEELKVKAKEQKLWNLWIPGEMGVLLENVLSNESDSALLRGPGLSALDYAHCAEMMGASPWASECFNCSAPDTGNMEVLIRYGNTQQQKKWLVPLLRGNIRSCFAMTEPGVASSDATNIKGSIQSHGTASLLVKGRKWWTSGACDPRCKVAIFMGRMPSGPEAPPHEQQSMVLVPMQTHGVRVLRPLHVYGYDDAPHGHAEVDFVDVVIPRRDAILLGPGRGFEIAQGRLGPGRLHHCMRVIGAGERALQCMTMRASKRVAFKEVLAKHQSIRMDIGKSRLQLDAARLVVLEAARALDELGAKEARVKIAQAKALTPSTVLQIIDRAVQIWGGAGVSEDIPLARMWAGVRTLRLADGPDIVHLETIAKSELKGRHSRM